MASKFTMVAHQISKGNHIGTIHRTGCADITKDSANSSGIITEIPAADAPDLAAALAYYIDPEMEEMGYGPGDVKVLPCAKAVS